jgi:hypothetical protein
VTLTRQRKNRIAGQIAGHKASGHGPCPLVSYHAIRPSVRCLGWQNTPEQRIRGRVHFRHDLQFDLRFVPALARQRKRIRLCNIAELRRIIDNIFRYFKLDRLSIPIIDILGATDYLLTNPQLP